MIKKLPMVEMYMLMLKPIVDVINSYWFLKEQSMPLYWWSMDVDKIKTALKARLSNDFDEMDDLGELRAQAEKICEKFKNKMDEKYNKKKTK